MATREKIFAFIKKRHGSRGVSPTLREIARKVGISHQAVDYHIRSMVEDGLLERIDVVIPGGVVPKHENK